jgi:ABC-2 type transport system ATP-binding protein
MIETHDLTRAYGPKLALSGLDLRVEPGEILGFLGPNGAGKSNDRHDSHEPVHPVLFVDDVQQCAPDNRRRGCHRARRRGH